MYGDYLIFNFVRHLLESGTKKREAPSQRKSESDSQSQRN